MFNREPLRASYGYICESLLVYYLDMTGLLKNYAAWLLKIYSFIISVPKEMHELNKAQKVWLIISCPITVISCLIGFMFFRLVLEDSGYDYFGDAIYAWVFYIFIGFFLPLIAYWVIGAIHKLILWVRE